MTSVRSPGTARALLMAASFAGLAACAGLASGPRPEAVTAFAAGTKGLAQGIEAALDATERLDVRAAELEGARNYLSGAAPRLEPESPTLAPVVREANAALLASLVAYAQRLADLADGSEAADNADATARLLAILIDLAGPSRLPEQTAGQGIAAARVLVSTLTALRIGRTVADVASELQPTVTAIARSLDEQLGEIASTAQDAAHELRFNREQILIELRQRSTNDGTHLLSAYDEAMKEQALTEVTAALADAREGVNQLVVANAALARPDPGDAVIPTARLVALARKLVPLVKAAA